MNRLCHTYYESCYRAYVGELKELNDTIGNNKKEYAIVANFSWYEMTMRGTKGQKPLWPSYNLSSALLSLLFNFRAEGSFLM